MSSRAVRLYEPILETWRKVGCGPTALSILTGRPALEFAHSNKRRTGMYPKELVAHLAAHGYVVKRSGPLWNVLPFNATGVVETKTHYLVFQGKLVRDAGVDRMTWVFDHKYARRRAICLTIVEPAARMLPVGGFESQVRYER